MDMFDTQDSEVFGLLTYCYWTNKGSPVLIEIKMPHVCRYIYMYTFYINMWQPPTMVIGHIFIIKSQGEKK